MADSSSAVLIYLHAGSAGSRFLRFIELLRYVLLDFSLPAKRFLLAIFVVLSVDHAFAEDLYPAVYYRGKEYQGVHCISTNPMEKTVNFTC